MSKPMLKPIGKSTSSNTTQSTEKSKLGSDMNKPNISSSKVVVSL
jgi:hypothetical protein